MRQIRRRGPARLARRAKSRTTFRPWNLSSNSASVRGPIMGSGHTARKTSAVHRKFCEKQNEGRGSLVMFTPSRDTHFLFLGVIA